MKEFQYAFEVSRMIIFDVDYYTLGDNSHPHFATVAYLFIRSKADYQHSGQAQEEILPHDSVAYKFYKKWNCRHLRELSREEYDSIMQDIEKLKETYNYIEDIRDTFAGTHDSIKFGQRKNLSMMKLK